MYCKYYCIFFLNAYVYIVFCMGDQSCHLLIIGHAPNFLSHMTNIAHLFSHMTNLVHFWSCMTNRLFRHAGATYARVYYTVHLRRSRFTQAESHWLKLIYTIYKGEGPVSQNCFVFTVMRSVAKRLLLPSFDHDELMFCHESTHAKLYINDRNGREHYTSK